MLFDQRLSFQFGQRSDRVQLSKVAPLENPLTGGLEGGVVLVDETEVLTTPRYYL